MKKIFSNLMLVLVMAVFSFVGMGCAFSQISGVSQVVKSPALPKGYVNASYVVECPSHSRFNALDRLPVHYYGPDFNTSNVQWRRDEWFKSCRDVSDGGDQPGPDAQE